MAKNIKESRALIGGNLDSTEKTEYEDWLEKIHKKIDDNKGTTDKTVPPLFDDYATANGYHCDCGKVYDNIAKLHKDEEEMKKAEEPLKESKKLHESDDLDFEEYPDWGAHIGATSKKDDEPDEDFDKETMHQIQFDEVEDFPEWALDYVINGVSDNLSDEEITEIENFLSDEEIAAVVSNDEESYNSFNKHPAFGDACGTYTVYVERA